MGKLSTAATKTPILITFQYIGYFYLSPVKPYDINEQAATYLESKNHYPILDGLRGVASVIVIVFTFSRPLPGETGLSKYHHGYLAVDFLFSTLGFVVAYAYDDRWGKMTLRDFLPTPPGTFTTDGGPGFGDRSSAFLFPGRQPLSNDRAYTRVEDGCW